MFGAAMTMERERKAEPSGVHRNAASLLKQNGIKCSKVLHVMPDSIWYHGPGDRLMTAWLRFVGAKLLVRYEPGTPPWPTVGLFPELEDQPESD